MLALQDVAMLGLKAVQGPLLCAGGEDLSGALHGVHYSSAEFAKFLAQLLALPLGAAEQPRRNRGDEEDERQGHEGEHRVDHGQSGQSQDRNGDGGHRRWGDMGGEQLQHLHVNDAGPGDVAAAPLQQVSRGELLKAAVERHAQVVQHAEGHDVGEPHVQESEHTERNQQASDDPDQRQQVGPPVLRPRLVRR